MKMKFLPKLMTGILAIVALASCGGPTCQTEGRDPNVDFEETPITDSLKLPYNETELENGVFAFGDLTGHKTGTQYGLVDLRSVTDGDTANFMQDGYEDPVSHVPVSLKTRFLGINTPESTAKMDPWGKKASRFTKHKLEAAQANADAETARTGKKVHNICLITDEDVFGYKEGNGRWLAFIWYRPTVTSDFRLLNLELVEQAYSKNQLFQDSEMCPYRKYFEKADAINEECGYRVHGEVDVDYVPENIISEITLWDAVHSYDEYGALDEEGTSGQKLHILAQVVGIQGDNLILRDVLRGSIEDKEQPADTPLQTLYAYAGFNTGLCAALQAVSPETDGVGCIVYFYGRATKFGGNIQLTDLNTKQIGKYKFQFVDETNCLKVTNHAWEELIIDTSIKHYTPEEIGNKENLAKLQYNWISTEIELRTVKPFEEQENGAYNPNYVEDDVRYWFRTSDNGATTYYAKLAGTNVYLNLRCDASLFPMLSPSYFDKNVGKDGFNVNDALGKTYHVTGYVVAYFENFQLTLPNNYPQFNYIHPVTNA